MDGCTQIPPQISAIALSPRIARAGRRAKLSFTLTEDAAVEVRLRRAGREREQMVGQLDGHEGGNETLVETRRLKPGTYVLTVQATDPTGLSRTKTTRLRVVARSR